MILAFPKDLGFVILSKGCEMRPFHGEHVRSASSGCLPSRRAGRPVRKLVNPCAHDLLQQQSIAIASPANNNGNKANKSRCGSMPLPREVGHAYHSPANAWFFFPHVPYQPNEIPPNPHLHSRGVLLPGRAAQDITGKSRNLLAANKAIQSFEEDVFNGLKARKKQSSLSNMQLPRKEDEQDSPNKPVSSSNFNPRMKSEKTMPARKRITVIWACAQPQHALLADKCKAAAGNHCRDSGKSFADGCYYMTPTHGMLIVSALRTNLRQRATSDRNFHVVQTC
eukprot:4008419-Amphidinium_carterae.1